MLSSRQTPRLKRISSPGRKNERSSCLINLAGRLMLRPPQKSLKSFSQKSWIATKLSPLYSMKFRIGIPNFGRSPKRLKSKSTVDRLRHNETFFIVSHTRQARFVNSEPRARRCPHCVWKIHRQCLYGFVCDCVSSRWVQRVNPLFPAYPKTTRLSLA